MSKDKEFRVIQGKSANLPYPPNDIDDAMTLFVINVPPYAADIREVKMTTLDNRRLTMKELSSLNKRVERLEFFTSLDNVEKTALADPTQYADGTEKEKYGVVGENFTNFNIADFRNPDFTVAVEGGFMIPTMINQAVEFKTLTTTDVTKNKRTLSLDYTETPAITQSVASKAVPIAPFLFGRFNGQLDVFPQTDFWVSDRLKPEVVSPPMVIVEQPLVIRERFIEIDEVSTIPFVYANAASVIIEAPNTDPPGNTSVVTVQPAVDPPPVVTPSPQPPQPPPKIVDPPPPAPIPPIETTLPEPITINIDPLWGGGGMMTLYYMPYTQYPNFFVDGYTGIATQTTESNIPTGDAPIVATSDGLKDESITDTGGGGYRDTQFFFENRQVEK